jgi:hypothetical protein
MKQTTEQNIVYSNCQEDLAALLFILLFNQVSSLEYYYESIMDSQRTCSNNSYIINNQFDLSFNLKIFLNEPFNMSSSGLNNSSTKTTNNNDKLCDSSEIKQQEKQQWQAFELNYRLNSILKKKTEYSNEKMDINFKDVLDKKFRLYWNLNWHGGSIGKLCNDLLYNPQMIQNKDYSHNSYSSELFLNDDDKFLIKYSNPFYLMKQFCEEISKCLTHEDALNLLDLTQILIAIIESNKQFNLGIDNNNQNEISIDSDFNLDSFFNRHKSDWHLALNRFASILPSNKSKSDQLLFSNSFQTIAKMLYLQSNQYDNNLNQNSNNQTNKQLMLISPDAALDEINSILSIDKWLFNMTYNPSSTLVLMIKQFLIDYESDELRIKYNYLISKFFNI